MINSAQECIVCSIKFNTTTHTPMILVECGHTLCKPCSNDLKICPICYEQVNPQKRIVNKVLVQNHERQSKTPQHPCFQEVRCPNAHPCQWRGQKSKCFKCSRTNYGWYCSPCAYMVCDRCQNTPFLDSHCPNGHKNVWRGKISLERDYKLGRPTYLNIKKTNLIQNEDKSLCRQQQACCGYQTYASKKGKYHHKYAFCLQKHPKYFAKQTEMEPVLAGWVCDKCLYIKCLACVNHTDYYKSLCPNEHMTSWEGCKGVCAQCQEQKPGGWKCKQCEYMLCENCVEENQLIREKKMQRHIEGDQYNSNICWLF